MSNLDIVLLAIHERLFPLSGIRPESADESRVLSEAKQSIKDLFLEIIENNTWSDGCLYPDELQKAVEDL